MENTRVHFCGRLSTYTYIDQDQAIDRAFDCVDQILGSPVPDM